MFRRSLAGLLASVVAVAVSLSVSPSPAHAATTVYYAGGRQTVSASVLFANFGVGKPVVAEGETHSAAMMVARDPSSNGVGIGWMVDRARHGDDDPHLVVAWWKDGAGQCYNTECPGFTPWAGATIALGQKFTPGTPQRFGIQRSGDGWWLWAGTTDNVGSYIGYFSDSNWTAPWPLFSGVQLYGQVIAPTNVAPVSEMGNGLCSSDVNALTISSVSYSTTADKAVNLSAFATYPRVYSSERLTARTIRYGGSGICD